MGAVADAGGDSDDGAGDEAAANRGAGSLRMFFAPQSLDDLGSLPVPEAALEAALARLRPLPMPPPIAGMAMR